jgi:hypothetical protein
MRNRWLMVLLYLLPALLVLAPASPSEAQVNMRDGKWEITSEMSMEGMPFQMPPTKTTQCITKENLVPQSGERKDSCKVLSQSIVGNKVTWKVRCVEKDVTTEGEGEITYTGNSYKGAMTARMTDKSGKTETVKMKLSGLRVGECTEADKKEPARMQAMAEQSKAGQQEYEAGLKKGEDLAKSVVIPEEGPGACLLTDNSCLSRFGQLNLQEGEWEMVEEMTSTVKQPAGPAKPKTVKAGAKDFYTPVTTEASKKCLTEQTAQSYTAEQGCVKEEKRSGDRITWKHRCTSQGVTIEEKGGINYNGNRYDGAKIRKTISAGGETIQTTKLTGRRLGDGMCVARRDGTSRRQMTTGEETGRMAGPEKVIEKPVKALKKLFGF